MIIMSWIETIVAVIGAVGGLEFFKWLFTRKQNARMAETKADEAEFEKYQKQIDYANERLLIKDQRIEEKDKLLSLKDDKYHELAQKYHEREFELKEMNGKLQAKEEFIGNLKAEKSALLAERKMKLCERRGCADRQPQSGY